MGVAPDLKNPKTGLAIWLTETKDGHVKLSVSNDGQSLGTVIDFNNQLCFNQSWKVYIIECKHKETGEIKFYTGKTYDLEKRFKEHVAGKGSKWMKNNGFRPRRLMWFSVCDTESDALEMEQRVKGWSHDKKQRKCSEFWSNNQAYLESHVM